MAGLKQKRNKKPKNRPREKEAVEGRAGVFESGGGERKLKGAHSTTAKHNARLKAQFAERARGITAESGAYWQKVKKRMGRSHLKE